MLQTIDASQDEMLYTLSLAIINCINLGIGQEHTKPQRRLVGLHLTYPDPGTGAIVLAKVKGGLGDEDELEFRMRLAGY